MNVRSIWSYFSVLHFRKGARGECLLKNTMITEAQQFTSEGLNEAHCTYTVQHSLIDMFCLTRTHLVSSSGCAVNDTQQMEESCRQGSHICCMVNYASNLSYTCFHLFSFFNICIGISVLKHSST